MNHYAFILMLIAHVLSDFYIQSDKMAQAKKALDKNGWKNHLKHALIYLIVLLVFMLPFVSLFTFILCFCIAALHFAVDLLFRGKRLFALFVDQLIHVVTLIIAALLIPFNSSSLLNNLILWLNENFANINFYGVLLVALFVLINAKPVNILIAKVFERCRLNGDTDTASKESETKLRRGSIIGIIERLLMLVLILCGEYLAGTIVVAVKSVGRIKKLDDPDFSDKFIIGSLFSILAAVLSSVILKLSLNL